MDLDRAKAEPAGAATVEDVSEDAHTGDGIVEPDGGLPTVGLGLRSAPTADVVEVVATVNVAEESRIAPHIDGALVIGFQDRTVDFIALHQVVIATHAQRAAGNIMKPVMLDALAYARDQGGGSVSVIDAGEVVDMAVFGEVPGGGERFAVAASENNSAPAQGVEVTRQQPMSKTAADLDAIAGQAAQRAASQHAVGPARDLHPIGAAQLPGEPLESNPRGAVQLDQRDTSHRELNDRAVGIRWREQINPFTGAVQIPLAGRIQFREDVHGIEALPFPEAVVGIRWRENDLLLYRIQRVDLFIRVSPVIKPISVKPKIGFVVSIR